MNEGEFAVRCAMAAVATWRVTHLLAHEDGPADLVATLRLRLGDTALGRAMDCFKCLSLWVAAPMALFVSLHPVEAGLAWLTLSGAACLLERFGQEPVIVQPISDRQLGGYSDGMLRSETKDHEAAARDNA
jgi:hypothetical protein